MAETFSDALFGGYRQAQGDQMQKALAMADLIMKDRAQQHSQQMDEWMRDPNNPQNLHYSSLAKHYENMDQMNEDYKKSQAFDKAIQNAQKALSAGISPGVAYAEAARIDPEAVQQIHQYGLGAYIAAKKSAFDAQHPGGPQQSAPTSPMPDNGAVPPSSTSDSMQQPSASPMAAQPNALPPDPSGGLSPFMPPVPGGMGAPSPVPTMGATPPGAMNVPAVPPPGLEGVMPQVAGGMTPPGPAPMAPMQGAPMPSPMAGPAPQPMPPIPQGPPPGAAIPPQAALPTPGQAPPGALPPSPDQFTAPSMEEYLGSQSSQYLANVEKQKAAQLLENRRGQAALIAAQARETTAGANVTSANARATTADAAAKRADIQQAALDQHLGPYAKSLETVERGLGIQEGLAKSLSTFRDVMGAAATKNASTSAKNANTGASGLDIRRAQIAAGIWRGTEADANKAQTQSRQVDAMVGQLEKNYGALTIKQDAAQRAANANPNDPILTQEAWDLAIQMGQANQRLKAVRSQSEALKTSAQGYKHIADSMADELHKNGMLKYTDGKGAPPVTPSPRNPSTPRNRVDAASAALGIP